MTLPAPTPGLVIRYAYLWRNEFDSGSEDGRKYRPAVVVNAVVTGADGKTRVVVSPITHRNPGPERGLLIPPAVKAHLGLDDDRSWIVTDEVNVFVWPGVDLAPLPGRPGRYAYGKIPAKLFLELRDRLLSSDPPPAAVPRT